MARGGARNVSPYVLARPGVAVLPLQELVAEARLPPGGGPGRVGDGLQLQPFGVGGADEDRKRVLEPQRIEDREAGVRIAATDLVEHAASVGDRRLPEDRGQRRARVLDVDVDVAGADRAVADERAAQIQAPLDDDAARFERLRQQFAEKDLLGEVLRPDANRCLGSQSGDDRPRGHGQRNACNHQRAPRSSCAGRH